MDLNKFKNGIFPAFPACYDAHGNISPERITNLVEYCRAKGAKGVYITGSSGEFIYQTAEERKLQMKTVAQAAGTSLTVIAHVGATSTSESAELAAYAAECGIDAISSVPPFYFQLPDFAIMDYWNAMIEASGLPFILYNIPGTTGVTVSYDIFRKMLENPKVIGIKNTSMPVMDMMRFKACGGDRCVVFNGPDEQFVPGRLMGADSGIGSTYIVMLPLYVKANELVNSGNYARAGEIQHFITATILDILALHGHLMSGLKAILRLQGIDIGEARLPLPPVDSEDLQKVKVIAQSIADATERFC